MEKKIKRSGISSNNIDAPWKEENNRLEATFVFSNFTEALRFVNQVGEIAEGMQHHPDICLKNYKEVVVTTSTHDAGNTVTEKDHALARAVSELDKLS